jgi:type 2 lantibiotic biosynthesis protein LanM
MTTTIASPIAALEQAAARASTLDDRLSGACHLSYDASDELIAQRLEQWRTRMGPNPELFARRLAWDGWGADEQRTLLSDVEYAAGAPTPAWVTMLHEMYGGDAGSLSRGELDDDRALRPDDPGAFDVLFVPAIRYARTRVLANAPQADDALLGEAVGHLEWGLMRRLATVCQRALFAKFSVYRAAARADGGQLVLGSSVPDTLYRRFVDEHLDGAMLEFFAEYPVAGRLCMTAVLQWITAAGELIDRITSDRALLQQHFGGETPLGPVVRLKSDSGDTHDGGRAVAILEFTNGVRIVYKPRSVALDILWSSLVSWFNHRRADGPELRAAEALDRDGYGWVEFMYSTSCTSADEVAQYYERSGELLGLVHALAGNDYHYENIIPSGAYPVLIDHEALLTPRGNIASPGRTRTEAYYYLASETMVESVGATGLLPNMRQSQQGDVMLDMGGLASADNLDIDLMMMHWRHVNTDLMRLSTTKTEAGKPAHVPTLDGAPQFAAPYVTEIARGFERVYRTVVQHRDEVRALLDTASQAPVRFLCRNTSLYFGLLQRCQHPQFLRDGWRRAMEIDVLARPFVQTSSMPIGWPLIADERRSMEQGDIPLFATAAGSRDLVLANGHRIANFFELSAVAQSHRRLDALGEADLANQLEYIHASFAAGAARGVGQVMTPAPRSSSSTDAARWSREAAIAEAVALAEEIEARAIHSSEHPGLRAWRGIQYVPVAGRYALRAMLPALYDGYVGVAVLHAALHRVTGDPVYETRAMTLLDMLLDGLRESPQSLVFGNVGVGLGGMHGGSVYGLATIASLLGREEVLDGARAMAGLVQIGLKSDQSRLGVVQGTAGAALSLLKLHAVGGGDAVLTEALACGDAIVTGLRKHHPYMLTGETPVAGQNRVGRGGIARGPAGVAFALLRLDAVRSTPEWREMADTLFACDALLRATAVNDGEGPRVHSGWAEGDTGTAFVGLAAPAGSSAAAALPELLAHLRGTPMEGSDDLINGAMGRADILLAASVQGAEPALAADARTIAARVLARKRAASRYETGWGSRVTHLGLYPGLAGIAYEYLRLAEPAAIPSLLSLS